MVVAEGLHGWSGTFHRVHAQRIITLDMYSGQDDRFQVCEFLNTSVWQQENVEWNHMKMTRPASNSKMVPVASSAVGDTSVHYVRKVSAICVLAL